MYCQLNHVSVFFTVISFSEKKRSKESRPGDLLFPALTVIKRARDTALILFLADVAAQLRQGE